MKKYRTINGVGWFILILFNIGLTYLFVINNSLVTLVALWFLIDLIEIKNITKIDIQRFIIFPYPYHLIIFKILLLEVLSVKTFSFIVALVWIMISENSTVSIVTLFLIYFIQVNTTTLLYHITYRYTKYSIFIRYLYLLPLMLMYVEKSNKFDLLRYIPTGTLDSFFLLTLWACITLVIMVVIMKKMVSKVSFIDEDYLARNRNKNWVW